MALLAEANQGGKNHLLTDRGGRRGKSPVHGASPKKTKRGAHKEIQRKGSASTREKYTKGSASKKDGERAEKDLILMKQGKAQPQAKEGRENFHPQKTFLRKE